MAHSDCGRTCGCAGKTVKSLKNTCYTWALLQWWFTGKRRYIKYMHLTLLIRAHNFDNTVTNWSSGPLVGWSDLTYIMSLATMTADQRAPAALAPQVRRISDLHPDLWGGLLLKKLFPPREAYHAKFGSCTSVLASTGGPKLDPVGPWSRGWNWRMTFDSSFGRCLTGLFSRKYSRLGRVSQKPAKEDLSGFRSVPPWRWRPIMPRPLGGYIKQWCCLMSICLSVCMSRTSGITRDQRPRKTKIDT